MRRADRIILLAGLALALAVGAPAARAAKPVGIAEGFPTRCAVEGVAIAPGGGAWFSCTEYVESHDRFYSRAKAGRVGPTGKVTEYTGSFPVESAPGVTAAGADGSFWMAVEGKLSTVGNNHPLTASLARVTPTGEVSFHPLGVSGYVAEMVASPDGYLWFATAEGFEKNNPAIWQISPAGDISKTSVPLAAGKLPGLTIGTDGNLWFADGGEGLAAPLSRLTPTGELTRPTDQAPGFGARRPTPPVSALLGGTVLGADGNLWYGVQSGIGKSAIGRLTPTGQVDEYRDCLTYGQPYFGPETLVRGAEGNIWFTSLAERSLPNIVDPPSIGMITPAGAITQIFAGVTVEPKAIAADPAGGAWFAGGLDQVERIKPPRGPVNTFHIGHIGALRRSGSALLPVKVPSGGRLSARAVAMVIGQHPKTAKRIAIHAPAGTAKAAACGSPQVRVTLAGAALRRLRGAGKVRAAVAVTFAPTGGRPYTEEKVLRFILPRRR